jgi:ubiquinone/menaquinone biosynthesis C-methylase UbiE
MKVDIGSYNANPELYQRLIDELYAENPPITLPPEYAAFFKNDLLRLFIRLARYKFVVRLIKRTDRLLEVGSGSGVGSIFLAQHCAHVTGLEVKTGEVAEARSVNRRENVEFVNGDLFELPADRTFDVVVALDVIEHIPVPQAERFVTAMTAHLKQDGMLVIGTPSLYSYEYQSALSKASHVKCYDQQELVALIERHVARALPFSMNDEMVHTGFPKMAWYYFVLGFGPKRNAAV